MSVKRSEAKLASPEATARTGWTTLKPLDNRASSVYNGLCEVTQHMRELGLVQPEEVAEELGYHINHVHRLLAQGKIKGQRYGRSWGIPREEVERIKQLREEKGRYWAE
jgi:excisionase family DNA binding protein